MIDGAQHSIYIEQLYIYKDWKQQISPFVQRLTEKAGQGVDIRVVLNYNPVYEATNVKCQETKTFFEQQNISVKFMYTNWSVFTNMHNKGMVVDNTSVLIASVNWNENSVTRNREAGVIIKNNDIAQYYASVFFYDWNLSKPVSQSNMQQQEQPLVTKNTIFIAVVFIMTFAVIAQDWRKREWT